MSYTAAELDFLLAHPEIYPPDAPPLQLSKSSQLADMKILKDRYGEFARAVMELERARASGKFPASWLADADSAQQATPPEVAVYRAEKIAEAGFRRVHDVTCSIGTEGAPLVGRGIGYVGSDLDAQRVRMARHNVPEGMFLRADALASPIRAGEDTLIVADPARRAGGRRITSPEDLLPPLPSLLDAHASSEMAVKCAPGIDYSAWDGLVSIVSVAGGVKEACLYTPAFGRGREAVILGGGAEGGIEKLSVPMEELGGEDLGVAVGEPGRYIIDPDGAVVRAGLVKHYAARYGLHQLDERIAYLSGDAIPPGRSGFPFIEMVPLKKLKAALRAHEPGALEILVRGVDIDPDKLRASLKLKGKKPMALVITRIGKTAFALICQARVSSTDAT